MKAPWSFTVATLLNATAAHAICGGAPADPQASPIGDESETGTRPWIELFLVKASDQVAMAIVDAKCKRDWSDHGAHARVPCPVVKAIEIDRAGNFIHPKAALPAGSHVQVTAGKDLIGDFAIKPRHATAVAATIKVAKREMRRVEGCQLKGLEVTLALAKADASARLDDHMLLVYLKEPDPRDPMANLAHIATVSPDDDRATLRNTAYQPTYVPASLGFKVWLALADNEGHLAPPVALTIK